jgi:multimeric flavodoxin WrbA
MNSNILVIVGSPNGKKGNSESLADCLISKLESKHLTSNKILLRKEIDKPDGLLELINDSDMMILSLPVYGNSVPGLVLEFFEIIYANKSNFINKSRKMFVISNSGFAEPIANKSTISHCELFAAEMGFEWMGGIPVSPGTLIDGKKLEDTGSTYKKVIKLFDLIADKICTDEKITADELRLVSKPFISPFVYRVVGKLIQRNVMKKIGKDKYFARPLVEARP